MKKILLFSILLIAFSDIFAFTTQGNWRWRNNDGTETTATWKAAQNTQVNYNSISEVIRLRIDVYNTGSDTVSLEDSLQYTTTPAVANSWLNINVNDPTRAFTMAGPNGFSVQNTPTTSQLTGNSYAFVPGKLMVDSSILKFVDILPSNRSEIEWAIMGTPATLPGTTYYFRLWGSTSNSLPPNTTYPSLLTSATVPIKLSAFSVLSDPKGVKIYWSTASEQKNDRFDVQKSIDGSNWSSIATVKGHGTTSQSTDYVCYDDNPENGTNYYRLKQYDIDGGFNFSIIKYLVFSGRLNTVVSVSPNPVANTINFKISGRHAGNVQASLSNANGQVIYQQTFRNVLAGNINQLSLQSKPAAGIYILKLQAEGISESIKLVLQ